MRRKRYAYENSEAMKIQRFDDAHRGDVGGMIYLLRFTSFDRVAFFVDLL